MIAEYYPLILMVPLAAAAWTDYKRHTIPDICWAAMFVLGAAFRQVTWQRVAFAGTVLLLLLGATLLLERAAKQTCLGGGDIKLLAAMAFAMEPLAWCVTVLAAEMMALVWAGIAALRQRSAFPLPQAPFLFLGYVTTLF